MLEIAPPGLETVTAAESTELDMLAGTDAVNCAVLTNVVASGEPFHITVAPGRNLVPLTVNVNAGTPSVAALGLRLVSMAAGGLIVNGVWLEVTPSRLTSVTVTPSANSIRLDGTNAVTCVALTSVVWRGNWFQRATTPAA
jgi:hypothetical protein